jgi:hypothetical protein
MTTTLSLFDSLPESSTIFQPSCYVNVMAFPKAWALAEVIEDKQIFEEEYWITCCGAEGLALGADQLRNLLL